MANDKFPRDISELISEYSEEGVFRIPKDITALQLNFIYKKLNKAVTIEVPCRSGLWIIEETPHTYLNTRVLILRDKEMIFTALEGKIAIGSHPYLNPLFSDGGRIQGISRLDICTKNKPLLSIILGVKEDQDLLAIMQLGSSAIALVMQSQSRDNSLDILNELMMESIVRANPTLPLSIFTNKNITLLGLDVTINTIDEYIIKPYNKSNLKNLGAGQIGISEAGYYVIYDKDGRPIGNVSREDFNPILDDILTASLLLGGTPFGDLRTFNSYLFEKYPTIKEAYKQITANMHKRSTYKDFLYLLPLIPYDLLVEAGKLI